MSVWLPPAFRFRRLVISLAACMVSGASADILLVEGNEVRRYSDSGTLLGTFAKELGFPLGITEGDSYVFVGQHGSGEIHKYDAAGRDMGAVLSEHSDLSSKKRRGLFVC